MRQVTPTAEDRDHIQRRLGMTYGIFSLIAAALLLAVFLTIGWLAPGSLHEMRSALLAVFATIALPALAYFACRGSSRSMPVIAAIDGGTLFGVMCLLAVASANAPAAFRTSHTSATIFALVVTLRAALVPSPPSWTALVGMVGSAPVAVQSYLGTRRETTADVATLLRSIDDFSTVGWCVAAVVAAWAISRVVYGMRVELTSAQQLGQYTLEAKIGEGGMGTVYRARHALLRRPTAVKLLRPGSIDDASSRRFEREVQLTSALTHPNTIAIYDYGHTLDGVFYYAMELLDGVSLAELVARGGPQPPGRVIHILVQVARALAEAHGVGLVHRDVKPGNVFLCTRGGIRDFVKLLDFGLVKEVDSGDPGISRPNAVNGTPLFMAPETIARPEAVDARVDLYALGAVGYFLLTGKPPFPGSNVVAVYHGHLYERPPTMAGVIGRAVPLDLEELLLSCLAKAPEDRPPSAGDLVAALARLQTRHLWTEHDARAAAERERSGRPAPRPDADSPRSSPTRRTLQLRPAH